MTNLDPIICQKLRDARRAAKVSQSELAAEVGCKQSAISMFEQGQPTKISEEAVEKIAKKFGIELVASETREAAITPVTSVTALPGSGFCPNPHCPGHRHYAVDGKLFLSPDRAQQDPIGARFCAVCGEALERRCPNCGAPVHAGAICSLCGEPYVPVAAHA